MLPNRLHGQDHEVGFHTGFGGTTYDNSIVIAMPFAYSDKTLSFYSLGLCYHYTPDNAPFSLKSGLNFDRREMWVSKTNYARIPIGLEFELGKKVQAIFGGGFFGSYMLSYTKNPLYPEFDDSNNALQWGCYLKAGVGIPLSETYNLNISYQQNSDFTAMYSERRHSLVGSSSYAEVWGFDGLIDFCLRYRFSINSN